MYDAGTRPAPPGTRTGASEAQSAHALPTPAGLRAGPQRGAPASHGPAAPDHPGSAPPARLPRRLASGLPAPHGLYHPKNEHDACGIGFVAHIKGVPSHDLVRQGLQILVNLDHRGARGADPETGDGAGILIQVPHRFLREVMGREGVTLPEPGSYGVGIAFLPRDAEDRRRCEETVERIVAEEGQTLLGWRDVPTCNESLGAWAKTNEPVMRQLFIGRSAELDDPMDFERKLYVISSRAHHTLRQEGSFGEGFYLASLSYRTLVYKGMLTPEQVGAYFADLRDPRLESAIVLTHSRFSTNTFPSWERAHPYRYLIHNGEINTDRKSTRLNSSHYS